MQATKRRYSSSSNASSLDQDSEFRPPPLKYTINRNYELRSRNIDGTRRSRPNYNEDLMFPEIGYGWPSSPTRDLRQDDDDVSINTENDDDKYSEDTVDENRIQTIVDFRNDIANASAKQLPEMFTNFSKINELRDRAQKYIDFGKIIIADDIEIPGSNMNARNENELEDAIITEIDMKQIPFDALARLYIIKIISLINSAATHYYYSDAWESLNLVPGNEENYMEVNIENDADDAIPYLKEPIIVKYKTYTVQSFDQKYENLKDELNEIRRLLEENNETGDLNTLLGGNANNQTNQTNQNKQTDIEQKLQQSEKDIADYITQVNKEFTEYQTSIDNIRKELGNENTAAILEDLNERLNNSEQQLQRERNEKEVILEMVNGSVPGNTSSDDDQNNRSSTAMLQTRIRNLIFGKDSFEKKYNDLVKENQITKQFFANSNNYVLSQIERLRNIIGSQTASPAQKVYELENVLNQTKSRFDQLKTEITELQQNLNVVQDTINSTNVSIQERDSLINQISQQQEQIDMLNMTINNLKQQLSNQRENILSIESDNETLRQKIDQLEEKNAEYNSLIESYNYISSSINSLQNTNSLLLQQNQSLQTRVREQQSQILQKERIFEDFRNENTNLIQQYQNTINGLNRELATSKNYSIEYYNRYEESNIQVRNLRQQVNNLEEKLASYNIYIGSLNRN